MQLQRAHQSLPSVRMLRSLELDERGPTLRLVSCVIILSLSKQSIQSVHISTNNQSFTAPHPDNLTTQPYKKKGGGTHHLRSQRGQLARIDGGGILCH